MRPSSPVSWGSSIAPGHLLSGNQMHRVQAVAVPIYRDIFHFPRLSLLGRLTLYSPWSSRLGKDKVKVVTRRIKEIGGAHASEDREACRYGTLRRNGKDESIQHRAITDGQLGCVLMIGSTLTSTSGVGCGGG